MENNHKDYNNVEIKQTISKTTQKKTVLSNIKKNNKTNNILNSQYNKNIVEMSHLQKRLDNVLVKIAKLKEDKIRYEKNRKRHRRYYQERQRLKQMYNVRDTTKEHMDEKYTKLLSYIEHIRETLKLYNDWIKKYQYREKIKNTKQKYFKQLKKIHKNESQSEIVKLKNNKTNNTYIEMKLAQSKLDKELLQDISKINKKKLEARSM